MITVSHITKRFGERAAVDDVSFTVHKGEMLGLLGPNGAGKTTTMRMITGFIPPTDGTVTVDGLDIFEYPNEVKKKIGYMPEQPPLYYDMTARECITFVAEVHGLKGKALSGSLDRVSELCGIEQMLSRLTGNLSKGYRQRVGLAQALVHDPDVLVLDEPTAGLDPKQIIDIRHLIKRLGEEKTVLLSSHILSEVTNVCGRVAIINNGRIAAEDSIATLSSRLSGGRRIAVTALRPERVDPRALSMLRGVKGAVKTSENSYLIHVEGDGTALDALSSYIVGTGAGLVEMRETAMTLEDIFLKVISGERSH